MDIGVTNKGIPVKHFTIGHESMQNWINEIKNKTQPSIIPDVDIVKFKGVDIVEISCQEFPVKPVACKGRYFKRVKNSNHLLSPTEIADLNLSSLQLSWDSCWRGFISLWSLTVGCNPCLGMVARIANPR